MIDHRTKTSLAPIVVLDRFDAKVIRVDAMLAMAEVAGDLVRAREAAESAVSGEDVNLELGLAMAARNRRIPVLRGTAPDVARRRRDGLLVVAKFGRVGAVGSPYLHTCVVCERGADDSILAAGFALVIAVVIIGHRCKL